MFPGDKGQPWCRDGPQKVWGLIRRRWNIHLCAINTKVVDRALQAADRLWDVNGSDQAQLENRELAMLTQG